MKDRLMMASLTLDEMEKSMILKVVEECGGNLSRSAEKLGIKQSYIIQEVGATRN